MNYYTVPAMSWHNVRAHQQEPNIERLLDRRTAVGIEQRPLDRKVAVLQVCTTVRFETVRLESSNDRRADAMACAGLQQSSCGRNNPCQQNGWLITTWLPDFCTELGTLYSPYKLEIITGTNYSLLHCKTFTGFSSFRSSK